MTNAAHSLASAITNEGWTFDEIVHQIDKALADARREALDDCLKLVAKELAGIAISHRWFPFPALLDKINRLERQRPARGEG